MARTSIPGLRCEQPREPGGLPAAAWADAGHKGRTKGLLQGEEVTVAKEPVFSVQHPHSERITGILQGKQQILGDSTAPTGTWQDVELHRLRTKLHTWEECLASCSNAGFLRQ